MPKWLIEIYELQRKATLAHNAVKQAIKRGDLPPPSGLACVDCGSRKNVVYEHRDYSARLDVVASCASCNALRGPAHGHKTLYAESLRRKKKRQAWCPISKGMNIYSQCQPDAERLSAAMAGLTPMWYGACCTIVWAHQPTPTGERHAGQLRGYE